MYIIWRAYKGLLVEMTRVIVVCKSTGKNGEVFVDVFVDEVCLLRFFRSDGGG